MKIDKDLENLSAYLDGELTPPEQQIVEQQLASSPRLREKLEELRRIREAVLSIPPVPEDPYFETRLMMEVKKQGGGLGTFISLRKPLVTFGAITILIMAIIKIQPEFLNEFWEEQQANLVEFYTNSLQPLVSVSEMSADDIFSFAFNQLLPIDKGSGKFLNLSSNDVGKAFLEIKDQSLNSEQVTLDDFVRVLNLNAMQKKQVDSILNTYSDRIASAVLVSDNKSVAVKADIWNLQAALRADLLAFAKKVNPVAVVRMIPKAFTNYDPEDYLTFAHSVREDNENTYFCISPDTVFSISLDDHLVSFAGNRNTSREEMRRRKDNAVFAINEIKTFLPGRMKSVPPDSIFRFHFKAFGDNKDFKMEVPVPPFPPMIGMLDSLDEFISMALKPLENFAFGFDIDTLDGKNKKMRIYIDGIPGSRQKKIELDLDSKAFSSRSIDSMVTMFEKQFSDSLFGKQGQMPFGGLDSLMRNFNFKFGDSTSFSFPKNFHKEFEGFRKEMDQFRKEMEGWRKNIQQPKKPKQVEI